MHFTLALTLILSLKGEVRLDGNRPLEKPVRVELFRLGQPVADRYTTADGSFEFHGLDRAPYTLIASSTGYPDTELTVDMLATTGDRDILINLSSRRPQTRIERVLSQSGRYLKAGRYSDAERLLKETLRKRPAEGDAYSALALVYFEQNRWEDAILAGTQAHSRNHRNADVHLILAKCFARLRREAGVRAELEMFLKEAPNGPAKNEARKVLEMLKP